MKKKAKRKPHKPRRDKFFRVRGGTTRIFNLSCSQCSAFIARYQKDGPGNLFRLYLDRILEPESLARLRNIKERSELSPLKCPKCGNVVGVPILYEPEKRLAFRVIKGSIRRQRE